MILFFRNIWRFSLHTVIYCLFSTVCFVGCSENKVSVDRATTRIKEIVCVGMDVDTAIVDLRKKGFRVGDKIKPTKKADYYQVNVVLRNKIPASESAKYVIGVPSRMRSYVVIKASLDGKIISVD
ncbi:MAG: hypothetical protein WC340_10110 [Kiritimatiellia bacterium]